MSERKKYYLITYVGDEPVDVEAIELNAKYDGDPHGDFVPFDVQSNQRILSREEAAAIEWVDVIRRIDNAKCLSTDLGHAAANTAAKAALAAACEVVEDDVPYTGGCKAFFTVPDYKDLGLETFLSNCSKVPNDAVCVIMADGGEFADMLNPANEQLEMMNAFHTAMARRGYEVRRINHVAYALVRT